MRKSGLVLLAVLGPVVVTATGISDIVVSQRWPFEEKVDVDYTLTGVASDVAFSATWAGRAEPFALGVALGAKPGRNRFTWDPSVSTFAGQTLADFRVTATPVSSAERTYLIVDLVNGGYVFASAVPDGGWPTADKGDRMVFRRIPAGTYTNGIDSAALTKMNNGCTPSFAGAVRERKVTFASDCYVGVFQMSGQQYSRLTGKGAGDNPYQPKMISYRELRGSTADGVDWPATKYAVATNSVVAKLRAKAGGDLVIDLCEEEQWEAAARAGTHTYWTNGGTYDEDTETWWSYVNKIAVWYPDRSALANVGSKDPNPWGLYDTVGNMMEWTLDKTGDLTGTTIAASPQTDPVGSKTGDDRIYRGYAVKNSHLCYLVSAYRWSTSETAEATVRFCIHLNPLDFGK